MLKKPQKQTNIFIILGNNSLPVHLNALSLLKNAICGPLSYFRMALECSLRSIEYSMATKIILEHEIKNTESALQLMNI